MTVAADWDRSRPGPSAGEAVDADFGHDYDRCSVAHCYTTVVGGPSVEWADNYLSSCCYSWHRPDSLSDG